MKAIVKELKKDKTFKTVLKSLYQEIKDDEFKSVEEYTRRFLAVVKPKGSQNEIVQAIKDQLYVLTV
jgi:hypothetical protein